MLHRIISMKRKILLISLFCVLLLALLPACDARKTGSLKDLTMPYIAQYECTEARFGNDDLFEKFEYIEINLVNQEKLELIYKLKNGDKKVIKAPYNLDKSTRELSAEIGILGHKFKQTAIVKNGKFTISKTIGKKQLVMKFKMK